MIIFSSTIRRRDMSPAGATQPQQQAAPAPTPSVQRPKKFQVVPVPGEFSRGRWKCSDTRGGSAMGVFGNYPEGAEYESVVTFKNKKITVRRKFYRPVVKTPEEVAREQQKENQKHVTVVNHTIRDAKAGKMIAPGEEIEVIIMSPQEKAPVEMAQSSTVIISSQTHTTSNPALDEIDDNLQTVQQVTPSASKDEDEGIAASTSSTVVAIDNKIVQAMDLVKTHLTFAVREEVETLRSHISDLESRLSALREENRQLREHRITIFEVIIMHILSSAINASL
ncbi:unnamed protein product [Caenorhabditis angaria]|uniref:Uncharacterized protein n=1 Tax=Caenorhabditis angaria TaxID=860376 RepID=A0A9P1J2K7_9PELO|nr:unnamed protein product [Caenorhabditis angaria]